MNKIKGNLIELAKEGDFDVIVHGCNCFCKMGAGIALQIKNNFPEAHLVDYKTKEGDRTKLGTITYAKHGDLHIVNAYTQYYYGRIKRNVNYKALREAFKRIKAKFSGMSIAYPAIGAGLAGGDWNVIYEIICEELLGENHTFVEYKE